MYTTHRLKFINHVRNYSVLDNMMKRLSSRKQLITIDKDDKDYSFKFPETKKYSKLDYSIDSYDNNFYLWLEHLCIPIKNKVKLKENDYLLESYLLGIRKDICKAVNDPPERAYYAKTLFLEEYLERHNIPVEQVYMSAKLYKSRIKAINLLGRDKLFEYYEQGKIPAICIE